MSHLKPFLNQDQGNIIANNCICSNFNYCLLILYLCYERFRNKIENIQKRTLRFVLNPIQDGTFGVCLRMGVSKKPPPSLLLHIYTLPKEDEKKYMNHGIHPLIPASISIFSLNIDKFCDIKKDRVDFILIYNL